MSHKSPGIPKGPEPAVTEIAVWIPKSLRERLDCYLDIIEARHGIKSNRGAMCGHALRKLLDAEGNCGGKGKLLRLCRLFARARIRALRH